MSHSERRDDPLATEEAAAAAAEAGAIGGDPGAGEDSDPADRAVLEGGGGYAEGFEASEDELIRNASHDDGRGDPLGDAFTGEAESDESGAEYSEADGVDPQD